MLREKDLKLRSRRVRLPFLSGAGQKMPATVLGVDYRPKERISRHRHPVCQLIYGERGVMVVGAVGAEWIVPSSRALWVPSGLDHWIRMVGHVRMRTVYVHNDAATGLPKECAVVAVSTLLRELIREAAAVPLPYVKDSRDGRLMALILDEIAQLPSLPLGLPYPTDPRLRCIHRTISRQPGDQTTEIEWARKLAVHPKTVHRLFVCETGLTFGEWRRQARLLRALELLAKGERIIDVALAVGYDSPTAFSTMFRRQLRTSPSAYFRHDGAAEKTQGTHP